MIHGIPLSEWLNDVKEAFAIVDKAYREKKLTISSQNEYYLIAPQMVISRRGVINKMEMSAMITLIDQNAEYEFSCDDSARHNYQFQFVFAYVHAHVPALVFCEHTADHLMDYINANWNIFEGTTLNRCS